MVKKYLSKSNILELTKRQNTDGTPSLRSSIFRLRPPLPPPLTIFCLICSACCRFSNSFSGFFSDFDHPDFEARDKCRTTWKFGSIYRNPSVPFKRNEFVNSFWRKLSMEQWKNTQQKAKISANKSELQELHNIHVRFIFLNTSLKLKIISEPHSNDDFARFI